MRKWLLLVSLVLLGAAGAWFWMLGALPAEGEAKVTLSEVEGAVSVKAPGSSEFVLAKTGEEVAEGSVIRTGASSKATVDWYGSGESRLGPESELALLETAGDGNGSLRLRLRLEAGRLWSRVVRILDLEGDVSVETSDVVATVRGTSFDLEKKSGQPTTLWVADSVVEAAGATVVAPQDGFFVAEGSMATFGGAERATSVRALSEADRGTDWFKNNREADMKFHEGVRARLHDSLADTRVPTGGFVRDIVRSSEALRERVAPADRKQRLAARYFLRRLAVIHRTVEEGKSGLAFQEFARLDGELRGRLAGGPAAATDARPAVLEAQVLFQDVSPSDSAYRIKQQVEEWLPLVARSPAERVFVRLFMIGIRLDEASRAMEAGDTDQAKQMLVLARQGLGNADREARETKGVETKQRERLRKQWKALSVRATALEATLAASMAPPSPIPPPIEIPTAPTSTVATSTPPVIRPVPTSTPAVQPKPVSLRIEPAQASLAFFQSVTYRAVVVYDTGLTRDVTKATHFQASPTGYGAWNGNVFTATQLQGTVQVMADYAEGGMTVMGTASLTIHQ